MKTQWTKFLAAAVIVSTAPANAIPVTFDFAGTVAQVVITDFAAGMPTIDLSTAGQSFNAQFTIDTDLFGPGVPAATDIGDRLGFSSLLPGAVTASLFINGESIDVAPYDSNRANASFLDSNGVVSCGAGCSRLAPDQFSAGVTSENLTPVGPVVSRNLSFSFVAPFAGFDNPETATSWFDLSPDFDLTQIGSLPLLDTLSATVFLTDFAFDCTDLRCQQTGSRRTVLGVTSVSRVASVPEPATLGLLACGIAAAMITRRRKQLSA